MPIGGESRHMILQRGVAQCQLRRGVNKEWTMYVVNVDGQTDKEEVLMWSTSPEFPVMK